MGARLPSVERQAEAAGVRLRASLALGLRDQSLAAARRHDVVAVLRGQRRTLDGPAVGSQVIHHAGYDVVLEQQGENLSSRAVLLLDFGADTSRLAELVPPMGWLVEGVWPAGSYGTLAGERRTLKT